MSSQSTSKTWPDWTAWLILPLIFLFNMSWIIMAGLHGNQVIDLIVGMRPLAAAGICMIPFLGIFVLAAKLR